MEYRTLDITVVSAKGLKNTNFIGDMDVYAVVSILGGTKTVKLKTPIHKKGGTNPTWNFPMKFNIDEAMRRKNKLELHVTIKAVKMFSNKNLGEVIVMIERLISEGDKSGENAAMQNVSYEVKRRTSNKPKGNLNISYKFSEKIVKEKETVDEKPRKSDGCCTGCLCGMLYDGCCYDNNGNSFDDCGYSGGDGCTCGGCDCGGCDCGGCDC